jgi:hypothetical protein
MTLTHVTAVRNELANIVLGHINDGPTAGKVQITKLAGNYTGSNLLVTVVLADPAFPAAAGGSAAANGLPVEGIAGFGGIAVEFRVADSTNAEVFRGTVTLTGMGGDMVMTNTTIVALDIIRIQTFTYAAST